MVEQLAPPTTTRSLRNLVPQPRQVDLQVPFDFDSAQLRADSRPLLDRLALTMQDTRLERLRFRIEGHTDATGGADHNDRLSERRAQAVAQHLIQAGVGSERLDRVGKGSREPLLPQTPQAPDNRRVRVVAID
jgi:outer membrane protein OmpA-like peptidoglycan-associated protein